MSRTSWRGVGKHVVDITGCRPPPSGEVPERVGSIASAIRPGGKKNETRGWPLRVWARSITILIRLLPRIDEDGGVGGSYGNRQMTGFKAWIASAAIQRECGIQLGRRGLGCVAAARIVAAGIFVVLQCLRQV